MPRYASNCPLDHELGLNSVAVPDAVPATTIEEGTIPVLGTRKSRTRSPVAVPPEFAKRNVGGLLEVGLFVPLSAQVVVGPVPAVAMQRLRICRVAHECEGEHTAKHQSRSDRQFTGEYLGHSSDSHTFSCQNAELGETRFSNQRSLTI
jgi:hypothetical protein